MSPLLFLSAIGGIGWLLWSVAYWSSVKSKHRRNLAFAGVTALLVYVVLCTVIPVMVVSYYLLRC